MPLFKVIFSNVFFAKFTIVQAWVGFCRPGLGRPARLDRERGQRRRPHDQSALREVERRRPHPATTLGRENSK